MSGMAAPNTDPCDCEPGHSCRERDRIRAMMNRRFAEWEKAPTREAWDAYDDARQAMADHLSAAAGLRAADRMAADGN